MDTHIKEVPFHELPITDNFMFAQVMRQEEICKLFLEALLQKKISRIEYSDKEKDISDEYAAHGVRLDVYLEDENNSVYNIEMQATNPQTFGAKYRYDLEQRIRYYQSNLDRHTLDKGVAYSELGDSYVIFVCDFDYFSKGLAVYEKYSGIKNTEVAYEDGSHVFVLNAVYTYGNAAQPILEFLDFVHSNDMAQSFESELMQKVCPAIKKVRTSPERKVAYMTWKMSQEDAKREGMEIGERKNQMATVKRLRNRFSDEEIIDMTGYPQEVVYGTPRN